MNQNNCPKNIEKESSFCMPVIFLLKVWSFDMYALYCFVYLLLAMIDTDCKLF